MTVLATSSRSPSWRRRRLRYRRLYRLLSCRCDALISALNGISRRFVMLNNRGEQLRLDSRFDAARLPPLLAAAARNAADAWRGAQSIAQQQNAISRTLCTLPRFHRVDAFAAFICCRLLITLATFSWRMPCDVSASRLSSGSYALLRARLCPTNVAAYYLITGAASL